MTEKKMITHDSFIMRLKFPGENLRLGIDIGQHIRVYGIDSDGDSIFRSYTPISRVDQKGYMDLLIKVYFPNEIFPKGGELSQYLHNIKVGQKVRVSGPKGKLSY